MAYLQQGFQPLPIIDQGQSPYNTRNDRYPAADIRNVGHWAGFNLVSIQQQFSAALAAARIVDELFQPSPKADKLRKCCSVPNRQVLNEPCYTWHSLWLCIHGFHPTTGRPNGFELWYWDDGQYSWELRSWPCLLWSKPPCEGSAKPRPGWCQTLIQVVSQPWNQPDPDTRRESGRSFPRSISTWNSTMLATVLFWPILSSSLSEDLIGMGFGTLGFHSMDLDGYGSASAVDCVAWSMVFGHACCKWPGLVSPVTISIHLRISWERVLPRTRRSSSCQLLWLFLGSFYRLYTFYVLFHWLVLFVPAWYHRYLLKCLLFWDFSHTLSPLCMFMCSVFSWINANILRSLWLIILLLQNPVRAGCISNGSNKL